MRKLYLFLLAILPVTTHAQLTSGLVAWWSFSGNVADSSGNAFHGTSTNISFDTGRNGIANSAAAFNGTSSFITAPYATKLNITRYSICATVKLRGFYTGACHVNTILMRGPIYASGSYGLEFTDTVNNNCSSPADTNAYTFVAEAGANSPYIPIGSWHYPTFLHTAQWYSVIATYDSLQIRIYVNGNLVDSAAPVMPVVPLTSTTDSLFIGTGYNGPNSGYPYWFNGLIDDLRIYDRVLSDNEISIYNTLSVADLAAAPIDVRLYPNPASDNITIEGSVHTNNTVQISMVNNIGQLIYNTQAIPVNGMLKHSINVQELSTGLYFVKLQTANGSKTFKLTIQ